MTLIISHRGNLNGSKTAAGGENSLVAIETCLAMNFGVEIDVQYINEDNNILWMGHDNMEHKIPTSHSIFYSEKLFLHAKFTESLFGLIKLKRINDYKYNIFFHNHDEYTLTDTGLIWTYPNENMFDGVNKEYAIDVLPEIRKPEVFIPGFYGICTDFPMKYANMLNERIIQ